jgi:adenine-specific DNA-methyltransferase
MANGNRFGPDNPHPLSTLKTELVWEGKYDEYGNRREIDVAGCAMPLQKIETIDEPRSRAEAQGKLFDSKKSHPDDFRNILISVQVYRAPRKRGHGRTRTSVVRS